MVFPAGGFGCSRRWQQVRVVVDCDGGGETEVAHKKKHTVPSSFWFE